MPAHVFLPLVYVCLLPLVLGGDWRTDPQRKRAVEIALVVLLGALVLRYLHWRLFVTVLPVEGFNAQSIFVWGLFLVELISWLDATILFMALLRRTDRSPEASRHEARLRSVPQDTLPTVDVFIATYNEPMDVLEKTIVGALALDWPPDRLTVHVLDDGRRDWLRHFCEEVGAVHMTRSDNSHAKAGNINAAIKRTSGELFLVLDADFVPQRNFLYRAAGFFEDDRIGIVQIPHNFFNGDPMQSNLRLRQSLPDDQRLFFDAIMPGRDGWDCAFCCGSNALTRRRAMEAVGGGLPTGSITEDMLLTLALLRKGYVTRYLNERLAVGLAAESLSAFFVQRARWAQGAMQILYLKEGPLGPGLTPAQRLLFLPTHWLTQSLCQVAAMATPAIYLWTGLLPLVNANAETVIYYQLPAVLGTLATLRLLAPGQFFPLAASAHGVLQAFRLMPTILFTLVKPHGHKFKVTPKGGDAADGTSADRFTVRLCLGLILLTATGLVVNANFNWQIIEISALIPIVAAWAIYNMVVLSVVAAIAVSPPMLRAEERFPMAEPCRIWTREADWFADLRDASLSGIAMQIEPAVPGVTPDPGDWIGIEIAGVGRFPGFVRRRSGSLIGAEFGPTRPSIRHRLIARLFTDGIDNSTQSERGLEITLNLLRAVVRGDRSAPASRNPAPLPPVPDWLATRLKREAVATDGDWQAVHRPAADDAGLPVATRGG